MEKLTHWPGRNNPSFSSSLLDAVYRSIDEPDAGSPSSASKRQIISIHKKRTPKPPPPANFRRHSHSTSPPRPIPHRSNPLPETKTPSSIRTKICNLRNIRAPASPTTRLAAFLNAMFAGGGGKVRKEKFAGGPEESVRSCSRGGKQRSVEGGFEKRHFGEVPIEVKDRRMLVEELLRGFDVEEEESDCESVSSSELFELESLSAIGRFRDGLPVYETTNLNVNHAIDHEFIV